MFLYLKVVFFWFFFGVFLGIGIVGIVVIGLIFIFFVFLVGLLVNMVLLFLLVYLYMVLVWVEKLIIIIVVNRVGVNCMVGFFLIVFLIKILYYLV